MHFELWRRKYLRLAKYTEDPRERSKFIDYAMLYAQLSEQAEWRETPRPTIGGDAERRNVSRTRKHHCTYDLTVDDASSTLRVTA